MEQFSEGVGQADGVSIVSSLYVQRREHPDMLERFREQVILPGREKFLIALRVGVDRGQVKPDADLELAVDTLIGAYLSRTFTGSSCDDGWAERLVGQIWPGLSADRVTGVTHYAAEKPRRCIAPQWRLRRTRSQTPAIR